MGKYDLDGNNNNQIVQELKSALAGESRSQPAYWNGFVYFSAFSDPVKAYTISNGLLSTTPVSKTPVTSAINCDIPSPPPGCAYASPSPTVSANGTTNGILWLVFETNGDGTGILYAYDATNLNNELYNSTQVASRDTVGTASKFVPVTVVNGKVYVAATECLRYPDRRGDRHRAPHAGADRCGVEQLAVLVSAYGSGHIFRIGREYLGMSGGNGIDIAAVYQLLTRVAETLSEQMNILNEHSRVLDGHTRVLDAHTRVLDEHSRVLDGHTRVLDGHSTILDAQARMLNELSSVLNQHTRILGDHTRVLNDHTLILHDHTRQLNDLTHGQATLRQTLTEYHSSVMGHGILISQLEDRVRRIEHHLDLPPAA